MQRIAGAVLILAGLAALVGLSALFYAPIPNAPQILVSVGMTGVLIGALAGLLCLGCGFLILLAGRTLGGRRR